MKILFLSLYGEVSDLALRLKLEGNEVRLFIKDPHYKEIFDGIIEKVQDWRLSVSWCDLAVFDSNPMAGIWKQIKDIKPCFGGSEIGEILEHDREFGRKIMTQIGLKSPEAKTVNKIEQAIKHLKEHKVRHVVKPFGPQVQSEHLIIGEFEDGSDAIDDLERFKEQGIPYEGIEIQERKLGIEVGLSGWFNGNDWIYPINYNFEHKKFASSQGGHGMGFLTGERGTTMLCWPNDENDLFKITLDRIRPFLKKNNYHGQIDISMIIENGIPYALEWTPRFGVPAIFIEQELQKTPWGELLYACATGKNIRNQVSTDWAIGVVENTPGFPSPKEVKKRSAGKAIHNVKIGDPHVHLYEAKIEKGKLISTDGIGYPLVVTAKGETIEECRKKVYEKFAKNEWGVSNPGSIYVPQADHRIDIGLQQIEKMNLIKTYILR